MVLIVDRGSSVRGKLAYTGIQLGYLVWKERRASLFNQTNTLRVQCNPYVPCDKNGKRCLVPTFLDRV